MALNLSTTGIADGSIPYAAHVTRSIDALKGTHAYNLNPSGSMVVTGSFKTTYSGSTFDFNYSSSTLSDEIFSTIVFPTSFVNYANHANDANAALNGIPVGGFYHNAGALKIRLS